MVVKTQRSTLQIFNYNAISHWAKRLWPSLSALYLLYFTDILFPFANSHWHYFAAIYFLCLTVIVNLVCVCVRRIVLFSQTNILLIDWVSEYLLHCVTSFAPLLSSPLVLTFFCQHCIESLGLWWSLPSLCHWHTCTTIIFSLLNQIDMDTVSLQTIVWANTSTTLLIEIRSIVIRYPGMKRKSYKCVVTTEFLLKYLISRFTVSGAHAHWVGSTATPESWH